MKKTFVKTAAACGLCLTLLAGGVGAAFETGGERPDGGQQGGWFGGRMNGQMNGQMGGMNGQMGGMFGQMQNGGAAVSTVSEPTAVAEGLTTNSAASLEADYGSAETITMSESNNAVKIKAAGTYIVTGSCSDGSITVTKGTTGVVLVLRDLTLKSTSGAPLSVNKTAEAKIVVSGSVTLTDSEDPADETSDDADVADAYDGAAIKVKAGASACISGDGALTLNGNAKNGIKAGDETALVIDGPTVNITAANDAVNGSYDVAILSGELTISAGDDAIHADRVLTVGADGDGPTITVRTCTEGIEATVVNLAGGTVNVTSTDDGVNAANSDGTYASLGYSINVTGARVTVNAPRADGLDSNGNINLISGSATISSASTGGDAGLDFDGSLYISDEFDLNNMSGMTSMGGGMMGGQMGGMQQGTQQAPENGAQQNTEQGFAPAQEQQGTASCPFDPRQGAADGWFGAPDRGGNPMQGQMPTQGQMPMQGQMPTPEQGMPGGRDGGAQQFPFWMFRQMTR